MLGFSSVPSCALGTLWKTNVVDALMHFHRWNVQFPEKLVDLPTKLRFHCVSRILGRLGPGLGLGGGLGLGVG